jgi:hypothetical protein
MTDLTALAASLLRIPPAQRHNDRRLQAAIDAMLFGNPEQLGLIAYMLLWGEDIEQIAALDSLRTAVQERM